MLDVSDKKFNAAITKCFDKQLSITSKEMKIKKSKQTKIIKKNQMEIIELKKKSKLISRWTQ